MHVPTGDPLTRADRDFHEATAHLYDDCLLPIFGVYYDLVVRPELDSIAAAVPGREAIDVGCGTGGITVELVERGFRVRGIDHSPAMLSQAERKLRSSGLDASVELSTGDVRELPFPDASFDVLTCQGVLHHLPSLEPAVGECARVLRPGGRFLIAEPCLGSTLLLRLWDAGRNRVARPAPPAVDVELPEVPPHEEGPIDVAQLVRLLETHDVEARVAYWTHFEGAHRLPRPLTRALVGAGSRPWRHRSGNLAYVTGRKRPARL